MKLLNLFKSSGHHKRENKENNDPLLLGSGGNDHPNEHHNGQRSKSSRRVYFQSSGAFNKRRSCVNEAVDEDGGSEITLTATEVNRNQNGRQMPPNPYSVYTEPKRNQGPRSCPGGAKFFDFDTLDDSSGAAGVLERSLEARSEFFPQQQQHRRSIRPPRRFGGSVAVGGQLQQQAQQQPLAVPFNEIGNGRVQNGRHSQHREMDEASTTSSRYKNLPYTESSMQSLGWSSHYNGGNGNIAERLQTRLLREQEKLHELSVHYRIERERRKELQRSLKKEKDEKDKYMRENYRLQYIISSLLMRQQQQSQGTNLAGLDMNTLIGAAGLFPLQSIWPNTPSSSSAIAPPNMAGGTGSSNTWTPSNANAGFGLFSASQQQRFGSSGPGECLAPLLSSCSLLPQQQDQDGRPPSREDEVKVFRTGQHNTDSFSGSSRPTTGELAELERDKHDLVSDSSREQNYFVQSMSSFRPANFSSPEVGRAMAAGENGKRNGSLLLGISFSADDCPALTRANGQQSVQPMLVDELAGLPRDDGYATSETNMSTPGPGGIATGSECSSTLVGHPMRIGHHFPAIRRRSMSEGQLF